VRNVNDKNGQLQKQLDNVIREANGEMNLLNNKKNGKGTLSDHLLLTSLLMQSLNVTWNWSVERCASCRTQLGRETRITKS